MTPSNAPLKYANTILYRCYMFRRHANLRELYTKIWNVLKYMGKAVPLQTSSGPEGSRKLRFPDFMTTAQDCGKVVSLTHRPLLPQGNTPGTHFC